MLKKLLFIATLFLFLTAAKSPLKDPGELFIADSESNGPDAQISLCLNGRAKISCQTYSTTGYRLALQTVIPHHTYPVAGIKILSGEVSIPTSQNPSCTPYVNGYCLFSVNDSNYTFIRLVAKNAFILPRVMPQAHVGTAYSLTFFTEGTLPPLTWSINAAKTSTEINNNFTINSSTGVFTSNNDLSSFPPGTYRVSISVTDSQIPAVTTEANYTFFVNGSIVILPIQEFLGVFKSAQSVPTIFSIANPSSTAGTTYAITLNQGTYPDDLSLVSSSGSTCNNQSNAACFTGTISSSAPYRNYTFQLVATQFVNGVPSGNVGYATYTISVSGSLIIGPTTNFLESADTSTAYNELLYIVNSSNAVAPVSITNDPSYPPPTGLSFGTTQQTVPYPTSISGTPSNFIGLYTVGANAADNNNNAGQRIYQMIVQGDIELDPIPTVNPLYSLPNGTLNSAYSGQTIIATNVDETTLITWNADGLPNEMSITSVATDTHSITIGGTPTAAGTYTPQITAISTNTSSTGFAVYSLTITGNLTLTPATSTYTGTIGTPFSTTITCNPPSPDTSCNFTIQNGSLPQGLVGTSSGTNYTISGTPTYSGKSEIQLQATSTNSSAPANGSYAFNIASTLAISPNTYYTTVLAGKTVYKTVNITGFSGALTSCQLSGSIPPRTTQSCNLQTGVLSLSFYSKRYFFFPSSRNYYFRVVAADQAGNNVQSGLYQVRYCRSIFGC
jgi:hypothetical protein